MDRVDGFQRAYLKWCTGLTAHSILPVCKSILSCMQYHTASQQMSRQPHKMIAKGAQRPIAMWLMLSLELCFWTGKEKGPKATSGLRTSESGDTRAE